MVGQGRRWRRLGIWVLLVVAGLTGCQAGPRQWPSFLDECSRPHPGNKDWCLSIRFPNTV